MGSAVPRKDKTAKAVKAEAWAHFENADWISETQPSTNFSATQSAVQANDWGHFSETQHWTKFSATQSIVHVSFFTEPPTKMEGKLI